MNWKFLNKEEVKIFVDDTGIKAKDILLLQNKKSYFIIILDHASKIRISTELARKLM